MKSVSLPVVGMTCANCALTIERNLKRTEGVDETAVNYATERAQVAYDPSVVGTKELVKRVEDAG